MRTVCVAAANPSRVRRWRVRRGELQRPPFTGASFAFWCGTQASRLCLMTRCTSVLSPKYVYVSLRSKWAAGKAV
jgi:hypothetical protein